jgi:type IV fimbrial biogenesis protein FimT
MIQPSNRRQRGITLVELSMTVAIGAILAGVSVPSLEHARARRHLEGAAAQLETDIHFARSVAVARNQGVRVSFETLAGGSCYIVHSGGAGDCHCSSGGAAVCTGQAEALRSVLIGHGTSVQLQSNSPSMLFDPVRGTTTPTATIQLDNPDGSAIRQIVNIMGRVRSCSPTLPGYKRC